MVGDEHDDGVFAQPQMVQLGQHAPQIPIRPRNGCEIRADDFFRLGLARAAADEKIRIPLANGRAGKSGRHRGPRGKIRRELNFFHVVQIKKLLRRGRRTMRLHKPAGDEKRLVAVLAQMLNRAVGGVIIAMGFAVAFEHHDAVGIRRAAFVSRQRVEHIARFGRRGAGMNRLGFADGGAAAIVRWPAGVGGYAPRFRIVNAAVENFPGADGDIAMVFEQLRQRGPVRMRGAKIRAVAEHAGLGGFTAGEQRGAGRIAQGKLAIIPFKPHAGFGQRIQMRRLRAKPAAVATDFHAQVIGHQKQHVGFATGSAGGGG